MLLIDKEIPTFDSIIVGSGFGGSHIAYVLANAGLKVLMLERGDWVTRGPHNWEPDGTIHLTHFYCQDSYHLLQAARDNRFIGAYACVGGPSVFYGGVSMRFREEDFRGSPEIVGNSGAQWPIFYKDLEKYYTQSEKILSVAGESNSDHTEPYRSEPYPQRPIELAPVSRLIKKAAHELGFRTFRLPLAINYSHKDDRGTCEQCTTCDTYACAIQAKNDLATCILPSLINNGLVLRENTVALKLIANNRHITEVHCLDRKTRREIRFKGKIFIISGGAISSPHILLSSGLQHFNPGGHTVGRFLMRHCCAIIYGVFPNMNRIKEQFHKQLGIHDFYFGHPMIEKPSGKLGSIQQVHAPPRGLLRSFLPRLLGDIISIGSKYTTGLIVIAEDQPRYENRLIIDKNKKDCFGMHRVLIDHNYTQRDMDARRALVKQAKKILYKAGAVFCYAHNIKTLSHAVGAVRFGKESKTSALDPNCKFRGLENLYVVDGSFMPTSAGLNPSLTISANALRVGEHIVKNSL